jgi:hypothetical protein
MKVPQRKMPCCLQGFNTSGRVQPQHLGPNFVAKKLSVKGPVLPSTGVAKERNCLLYDNLTQGGADPKRETCVFDLPAHRVTKASRCLIRFSFPS